MKRVPSVLLPARAKNTSPGLTVRLSTARPDTSAALARGSIVASSLNSSPTLMIFQSGHGNCPVVFRSAETLFKRGTGKSEHRNPVPDPNSTSGRTGTSSRRRSLYALLACLRCRKNKALGRRQIETGLYAQKRCNPSNHVPPCRHRVPAGRDETEGFL